MKSAATVRKTAIYQKKRPEASRWSNKWIQSPAWMAVFGVAAGLCLLVYAANIVFGRVHPGSGWGIAYGIAATVLFVGILFWAVKRRTMQIRALGRAWPYLQFHVYGGSIFLLLMFMHTGFQAPHGVLTWWLWALSIWVVGTGLLGIAVQKWIPTLLNSGLSTEVHYGRIPELVKTSNERAAALVQDSDPVLREFYRKQLAPVLEAPRPRLIYFFDITGGSHVLLKQFVFARELVPEGEEPILDELEEIYRTKIEMDAHFTLQRALRWWLYLHVPVSIVIVALIAFHIFAVLYY